MKEGYLQNKLRELQKEVEELKKEIENLKDNNKNNLSEYLLNKVISKNQEFRVKLLEEVNGKIQQMYNDYLRSKHQEVYSDLHDSIRNEMRVVRKSNKDYILRFIDEVIFQRKDLSNVLNILVGKKICSMDEISKLDREVIKKMDKSNIKQHIWNQFYPILKTEELK